MLFSAKRPHGASEKDPTNGYPTIAVHEKRDNVGVVVVEDLTAGDVIAPLATGDHVHVHNLKTKRW